MKSLAPQRHGQSAWKVVSNEEDRKLILVVFIVSDSMETGQWVRLEIHVADKKQKKAERKIFYAQNPLLLEEKIKIRKKKRNLAADQSHVSGTWWRHY